MLTKKVLKREYKIQRIDGLPPKQVTPPPEVYERIKKDNKLIGEKLGLLTHHMTFLKTNLYIRWINI